MKRILVFLAGLLMVTSCGKATSSTEATPPKPEPEDNAPVVIHTKTGEIGGFNLLTPGNVTTVEEIHTFTWEAAENAETYTIEISSSDRFISDVDSVEYYKRQNIEATSFPVRATFKKKDITYYWRVTAENASTSKLCEETFSFFYKAPEVDEVPFDLGEADDWSLHPLGSHADIWIDRNNFFENDQDSLVISFKTEDTKRGIASSDGWIIASKTIERSIYGTDSLFFSMYYAGQDARVIIRLLDMDNETWYCPVQISNNAKQSVILRFEDFQQRFNDVIVANQTFDFERIKYLEVVFEKSFGDGILLLSGMKAIKYESYRDYFIDDLNFADYPDSAWSNESYPSEKTIDGRELTMQYWGSNSEGKPNVSSFGYGFAKLQTNRYFGAGDCIQFDVKYTGTKGTNVILRVYEEDTDRWSVKIPFSTLTENTYETITLPFGSFEKSYIGGDGKRQFYFILNLQFGFEGMKGAGTLSFKDFSIVKRTEVLDTSPRVIPEDGMVEDFNSYIRSDKIYEKWQMSDVNKDEHISLESTVKLGGSRNPHSGRFEYKSDMEEALYGMEIKNHDGYDGISFLMKDASVKTDSTKYPGYSYITNWSAKVNVYLFLTTGEKYFATIPSAATYWTEYEIPFSAFELTEDSSGSVQITSRNIVGVAFGFSFRYVYNGIEMPAYTISNPVYMDDIRFVSGATRKETVCDRIVTMVDGFACIENYEDYANHDDMGAYWSYGNNELYNAFDVSSDVSAQGGTTSGQYQYRSNSNSVSYATSPVFAEGLSAWGLSIDLKGDGHVTIYINIYVRLGQGTQKYRATISNVPEGWNRYQLGFANFEVIEGTASRAFKRSDIASISQITFGAVWSGDSAATDRYFYVDNFGFDGTITDPEARSGPTPITA